MIQSSLAASNRDFVLLMVAVRKISEFDKIALYGQSVVGFLKRSALYPDERALWEPTASSKTLI